MRGAPAILTQLCVQPCALRAARKKGLMREGAAWKNKKGLLEICGYQERGGEAKDLEMTVRVACVVGKPTGLVFGPFHHLLPAQS